MRELWKFVLLGLVSKCNLADTTWPNEVEYSSLTGNVNFVAWRLEEAGVDQWNIFLRQRWCEHCQLVPMIPLKRLTTQRPLYTLHVACPILTSSGSDKQWAGNFFGNIQNWAIRSVCAFMPSPRQLSLRLTFLLHSTSGYPTDKSIS